MGRNTSRLTTAVVLGALLVIAGGLIVTAGAEAVVHGLTHWLVLRGIALLVVLYAAAEVLASLNASSDDPLSRPDAGGSRASR